MPAYRELFYDDRKTAEAVCDAITGVTGRTWWVAWWANCQWRVANDPPAEGMVYPAAYDAGITEAHCYDCKQCKKCAKPQNECECTVCNCGWADCCYCGGK